MRETRWTRWRENEKPEGDELRWLLIRLGARIAIAVAFIIAALFLVLGSR